MMNVKLPAICFLAALVMSLVMSCGQQDSRRPTATSDENPTLAGQSAVKDDLSEKNVVQVAVGSPDHTTLVAAVKQAGLVDVLVNVGPFTVFAPVNAAFDELPPGTVDNLLKPENKNQLINILEYHVYVGVISENLLRDGMTLNQVNGSNVRITSADDGFRVNDARILGSVPASNGIVYVLDKVLIP